MITAKSADLATSTVLEALLLDMSASNSLPETEAVFFIEPVLFTLVTIVKVAEAPLAKLPTFQTPSAYLPTEALED